ncbi:hypothetical protein HDV03_004728 [Kappamyces sp. JEL0829]|nr:hypothetical protein HDV03_004728 [Kappamyces sp. JEL0829]
MEELCVQASRYFQEEKYLDAKNTLLKALSLCKHPSVPVSPSGPFRATIEDRIRNNIAAIDAMLNTDGPSSPARTATGVVHQEIAAAYNAALCEYKRTNFPAVVAVLEGLLNKNTDDIVNTELYVKAMFLLIDCPGVSDNEAICRLVREKLGELVFQSDDLQSLGWLSSRMEDKQTLYSVALLKLKGDVDTTKLQLLEPGYVLTPWLDLLVHAIHLTRALAAQDYLLASHHLRLYRPHCSSRLHLCFYYFYLAAINKGLKRRTAAEVFALQCKRLLSPQMIMDPVLASDAASLSDPL